MAEYNGKQGRWITTKEGKHLFIEDEVDKQEREIKEAKKTSDAYNEEHKQKSNFENNPFFRGIVEDAKKALKMPQGDFDEQLDKEVHLYDLMGKITKYDGEDSDIYKAVEKAHSEVEGVLKKYSPDEYDANLKRRHDSKVQKANAKEDLKNKVKQLEKEHPDAYVSSQGVVMDRAIRKGKSTDEYVADYKKAFEKAGVAYFIEGLAETPDNPAGIIGVYKTWESAKPVGPDSFDWGWFTDKDGKKKLWFYEPD